MKCYYVSTVAGEAGVSDFDGEGRSAHFMKPCGISVDKDSYIYTTDATPRIRKISPDGMVETCAGSMQYGHHNSTDPLQSRFHQPAGVSLDSENNIYVADFNNNAIRKISKNGVEDIGKKYYFLFPVDCAVDNQGNVYITDRDHAAIVSIDKEDNTSMICTIKKPNGICVSPTGVVYVTSNMNALCMIEDGRINVLVSDLKELFGIAADENYIYMCENHSIKRYSLSTKKLELVVGTEIEGWKDGPGDVAQFASPWGIAVDKYGCLYVADTGNHTIRKIVPKAQMCANWPSMHYQLPHKIRQSIEVMVLILKDKIPRDLIITLSRAVLLELFST